MTVGVPRDTIMWRAGTGGMGGKGRGRLFGRGWGGKEGILWILMMGTIGEYLRLGIIIGWGKAVLRLRLSSRILGSTLILLLNPLLIFKMKILTPRTCLRIHHPFQIALRNSVCNPLGLDLEHKVVKGATCNISKVSEDESHYDIIFSMFL